MKRVYDWFLKRTKCTDINGVITKAKAEIARWKVHQPYPYPHKAGIYSAIDEGDYEQCDLINGLQIKDEFKKLLRALQLFICCKYWAKDSTLIYAVGWRKHNKVVNPSAAFDKYLRKRQRKGHECVCIGVRPPQKPEVYDVFERIMINTSKQFHYKKKLLNTISGTSIPWFIDPTTVSSENLDAIALQMLIEVTTNPVFIKRIRDVVYKSK